MRLAIEQKDLLHHIQHLAAIVSTKTTSPIMTNFLIDVDADRGEVKITASDLDITAEVRFSAAVSEGGTIAVSAKHFNEIITNMPAAVIDLWKTEDLLMIQCAKIDFNILCADHTLYPILPAPNLENAAVMDAELFKRMIEKTSFAVSTDVNRAVLTGVCWKISAKHHTMAATDGRKVAEIIVPGPPSPERTEGAPTPEENIFSDPQAEQLVEKVIPLKTLNFLQKIHDPSVKELRIMIERNKMIFAYGRFTVITNILEHKFPEYQKAFVTDLPNKLVVPKEILHKSLRRIALVAPEDNYRIRFELDANQFEINTSDRDTGEAKEFIETYDYQGGPTSISFNYKFMLSILDAIDTEKVRIMLGSSKEPLMIYNEPQAENQQITFLLMPLRS
jgi:DNA polymerase-3 subunit beta